MDARTLKYLAGGIAVLMVIILIVGLSTGGLDKATKERARAEIQKYDDAQDGVKEVREEIERALKGAGITVLNPGGETEPLPGSPMLYVDVTALVDDRADVWTFSTRLELVQLVRLERFPDLDEVTATTWSIGGLSIYGKKWRESIVAEVVTYVEEFTEAYVAANPNTEG